jgi:hypothetical protein
MRMVVVLPAPLGPIKPKISPGLMLKLMPSKARICPNCLVTKDVLTAVLKVIPLSSLDTGLDILSFLDKRLNENRFGALKPLQPLGSLSVRKVRAES